MVVKKELLLSGLCCSNCAAKIEKEVKEIQEVESAFLNFSTSTLVFEAEEKNSDMIMKKTIEIVKRIEPSVKVSDKEQKKSVEEKKSSFINLENTIKLIGVIAFIIGIILKKETSIGVVMFLLAYILIGGEVLLQSVKNVLKGELFDENFLMSIATIGAIAVKQYPEAVAVMLFYEIGELFQNMAVNKSRKSITELMDIRPDYANLKTGNNVRRVAPEEVKIGNVIMVKPGEKIPLDGRIIFGNSTIDNSALTGESLPVDVKPGDNVLSGSINKTGVLSIKVTKIFKESTASKILDLVQNSSLNKAKTEKFITRFAKVYTPIVVSLAVILAVIPPILIPGASFAEWIYRASTFLVVSCPCALVISIPLGFFGGIGCASKNGILVKSGTCLEALTESSIAVFDKTGTLTKGSFSVSEIREAEGFTKDELLYYTAMIESYSNHPIALSVVKAYGKKVNKTLIDDYEEVSGNGVRGLVEGKKVTAGNKKFMKQLGINTEEVNALGTVVYTALDDKYMGYIVIGDQIKEDAKKAIKGLKEVGIKKAVMLTGDRREVADYIAKDLGLDEVYGELLPNNKVEKVEELEKNKDKKERLIFVGDGINDAPVLARADIGVAMGGIGSDAAIEAADMVIMNDEPSKLIDAIKIARRTKKIVLENIAFSLGVKASVLILAGLGMANMWEAVFADVGVTLLAVLNSLRVLHIKNN